MKKGFTLIELLAVVMVIAILSAIAMPQYRSSINRSRVTEAKQMLPAIHDSADRWLVERRLTNGTNSTETLDFNQLDITMKGHIDSSNNQYWITPNFKYTFQHIDAGGAITQWANAEMLKGKYAGLKIFYNNGSFSCTPPSGEDKQTYCDDLDL